MTSPVRSARPYGGGPRGPAAATLPGAPDVGHRPGGDRREDASASLETVLVLPVLALLVVGLLGAISIVADVLLLHEAARAGARAAATSTGTDAVVRAAQGSAPELADLRVVVTPTARRDGDIATVRVEVHRRLGPVTHRLRASAVARVEPAVGNGPAP